MPRTGLTFPGDILASVASGYDLAPFGDDYRGSLNKMRLAWTAAEFPECYCPLMADAAHEAFLQCQSMIGFDVVRWQANQTDEVWPDVTMGEAPPGVDREAGRG